MRRGSVRVRFAEYAARIFLVAAVIAAPALWAQREPPVEQVASHEFELKTASGSGAMPFEISLNWNKPQPQVTRAVVIFHGKGRDVEGYYRAALRAADLAGGDAGATTIVVAPQFLNEEDARAHGLSMDVLRWRQGVWEAGTDAAAPSAISAYTVIDAIVAHLADRNLFPNLKTLVLAGHSGGGQAMQRYAIVGHAEKIAGDTIRVRYVIANPSSFFYFTDDRPKFDGNSFRFEAASGGDCRNFDHWKYGPREIKDDEEYVKESAKAGWQTLEDAYAKKDVVYLLGTADIDPHQEDLDTSCQGEMEGPSRFLRGQAFYAWLHGRHAADWNQRMWFVPDVAHNATKMFTAECGVAALYERAVCKDEGNAAR
jgi:pimeloyl-ACP methyl ester carboxylesterase